MSKAVAEIGLKDKVDLALRLDKEIKERKKALDAVKADLQAEALLVMENRNVKWQQIAGQNGLCNVAYKEKFEIDSLDGLKALFGDMVDSKVAKKIEVKYEVNDLFKKALIALYKSEYWPYDLPTILGDLGLDSKQIKVTVKKLKGDYFKDKALLESLGITGDLEVELDAIRLQKNNELVSRFFDMDQFDLSKLQKAIFVEDGLSIGLVALGEEEDGNDQTAG